MEKPLSGLARPLAQLCDLGYVRRDVPFGEEWKETRRALYRLNDPFLRFFFRFVLPHESALAQGITREAVHSWRQDSHRLFAACWEELCRAAVPWMPDWDPQFGMAAAWWRNAGRQAEVDVAAVSLDRKTLLLGECKWSDSKQPFDLNAMDRQLRQKAELMPTAKGKLIVTSCWLGGNARTVGKIDRLIRAADVMSALMR
jgi:AAA+ ATPase superfamily predicted ATPase